jgi:hypothetical protein
LRGPVATTAPGHSALRRSTTTREPRGIVTPSVALDIKILLFPGLFRRNEIDAFFAILLSSSVKEKMCPAFIGRATVGGARVRGACPSSFFIRCSAPG